jgi:hypothetical protein
VAIIGLVAYAASNPGFLLLLIGVGLLGIGVWWWSSGGERRRYRALRLADVDSMAGHDFEHYVAALLEHQGHTTTVTKGSGDLGVDVIAAKGALRYAVQTKRYSAAVPRTAVSDAVAGMAHYKCNAAMVVTTHRFSDGAQQLARSTGCVLVDRDELAQWIIAFQDDTSGAAGAPTRPGLPLLNNVPSGFILAGAALVLCALVSILGQQGSAPPPPGQQNQAQQPPSLATQYRNAILTMNPALTTDRADRLAEGVLTASANHAVDGRLLMALLAAESNFDIGADPETKIVKKATRLRRAMDRAAAQPRTELQQLQSAIILYRTETEHATGSSRHSTTAKRRAANRHSKVFARKVIRLYYRMCGQTPPG